MTAQASSRQQNPTIEATATVLQCPGKNQRLPISSVYDLDPPTVLERDLHEKAARLPSTPSTPAPVQSLFQDPLQQDPAITLLSREDPAMTPLAKLQNFLKGLSFVHSTLCGVIKAGDRKRIDGILLQCKADYERIRLEAETRIGELQERWRTTEAAALQQKLQEIRVVLDGMEQLVVKYQASTQSSAQPSVQPSGQPSAQSLTRLNTLRSSNVAVLEKAESELKSLLNDVQAKRTQLNKMLTLEQQQQAMNSILPVMPSELKNSLEQLTSTVEKIQRGLAKLE